MIPESLLKPLAAYLRLFLRLPCRDTGLSNLYDVLVTGTGDLGLIYTFVQ